MLQTGGAYDLRWIDFVSSHRVEELITDELCNHNTYNAIASIKVCRNYRSCTYKWPSVTRFQV